MTMPEGVPQVAAQNVQKAKNVGGNAIQVGGNYTQTSTVNLNLYISIFLISILALGGLAWSLKVGPIQNDNSNTTSPTPELSE
jgi:hypothetical protein